MIKILSVIITSLVLMNGCAGIPDTGINKEYNFDTLKKITICVLPTQNPEKDNLISNLVSLYFLALGYNVEKIATDSTIVAEQLRSRNEYNTIFKSLVTRLNNDDGQAVFLINAQWTKNSGTDGIYRYDSIPRIRFNAVMFDRKTMEYVLTCSSESFASLLSDSSSRNQYIEPERIQIEKVLSTSFEGFPPCKYEVLQTSIQRFPIIFFVDNSYKEFHKEKWKTILHRQLLYTNDFLKKKFRIELVLQEYREWSPKISYDPGSLIYELEHLSSVPNNVIGIGITQNKLLSIGWKERNSVGFAHLFKNYIILYDQPTLSGLAIWKYIEEAVTLTHEVGHILGAFHTFDSSSIMHPTSATMSFTFDTFNSATIKTSIGQFLSLQPKKRIEHFLPPVCRNYVLMSPQPVIFLETVYGIIESYLQRNGTIKEPITSEIFYSLTTDSSVTYGLMGYQLYRFKQYKQAEEYFLRALKANQNFVEVNHYIGLVYELQKNEVKANYYHSIANKFGYSEK